MKQFLLVLAQLFVFTIAFAQHEGHDLPKQKQNTVTTKTIYTCPMHPEVQSNKPGTCPKCGMDLVKKTIKVAAPKTTQKKAPIKKPAQKNNTITPKPKEEKMDMQDHSHQHDEHNM